MAGFIDPALYPWVKAAHLIFVIFWIAGLFMLPRFLIYQVSTVPGSAEDLAWVERIRRLRSIILNPSMILVWLLGLSLALDIGAFHMGWFHMKLLLVLLLSAYHGWAVGAAKKIARGFLRNELIEMLLRNRRNIAVDGFSPLSQQHPLIFGKRKIHGLQSSQSFLISSLCSPSSGGAVHPEAISKPPYFTAGPIRFTGP